MRPYTRAVVVGAMLAIVAAVTVAGLVVTGALNRFIGTEIPTELLVLFVAPDAENTDSVPVAVRLTDGATAPEAVDTWRTLTIPGTSATSPRTAFPFGGGELVARSVSEPDSSAAWVAVPARTWASLVDEAGGMTLELPSDVSVYRDGRLTVLDAGRQKLAGADVVALVAALEYLEDADRDRVLTQLASESAKLVTDTPEHLSQLVEKGSATGSLTPSELLGFADSGR